MNQFYLIEIIKTVRSTPTLDHYLESEVRHIIS